MKYLDDHVGYVAGFTIILVAIVTGILVAEFTGITDAFISSF